MGLGAIRQRCENSPIPHEAWPSLPPKMGADVWRIKFVTLNLGAVTKKAKAPTVGRGFLIWRCDTYNR